MSNWADTNTKILEQMLRSSHLRELMAALAASVARTEEDVARTLDCLAATRPHDARRLQARAAEAREYAATERERAIMYGWTTGAGRAPEIPPGSP